MPYQQTLLGLRPPWLPHALTTLARHRFLTAEQLSAVTEVPTPFVVTVFSALAADGIVTTAQPAHGVTGAVPPPAYALTRHGASLVVDASGRPAEAPSLRRTAFRLTHDLARNDFGVVVEALHSRREIDLVHYTTETDALADHAWLHERGRAVRVPLVADALVVTRLDRGTSALFVETDRGTVSVERMRRKYAGYLQYWKDGAHTRRFGTASMRVLTICPDAARLKRLRTAAIEASGGKGSGVLWFMLQESVVPASPERVLEPVALQTRPDDDSLEGLYPRTSRPAIDSRAA